jgi:hypothetical protein
MSNTSSFNENKNNNVLYTQGGEIKVMKKIISVALSTAMAFSMFASVAFGDTAVTPQDKYDALKAKGIFTGFPDGLSHLELQMTRAEFAKTISKVMGLEEALPSVLSYKDTNYNAKHWAAPYIEAVTAAGIMQGDNLTKKLFNPKGNVSIQEMATVLVRTLKLEVPTTSDNSASDWAKLNVQAVINAGLLDEDLSFQSAATRALLVEATFAVEAFVATPPVLAPKVVSVTAPNAKQAVVKFTRAIDVATLAADGKLITNVVQIVALSGAPVVTTAGAEVSMNADGTEATITFPNTEFLKGDYTVVVNDKVKTTTAEAIPAYTQLLNVADTTSPQIATATAVAKTTTNKVYVKFSEPVKTTGIIAYVNGVAASVTRDTYDQLTLTTGTLESGKTYDVSLMNVSDFAGNVANPNPTKSTVTVVSDIVAPVIKSVTALGERVIEVKFDKKVSYESLVGNVRLLDPNGLSQGTFQVMTTADSDTIKLRSNLTFTTATFAGSIIFGSTVRDTLGNTLGAPVTLPVTFTKDTIAPTVLSAVYTSDKGLVVKFSEEVTVDGSKVITIINDSTGQLVSSLGGTIDSAGTTMTFPTSLAGGTYTLRMPSGLVKDISMATNSLAATTIGATVATTATTDTVRPTVTVSTYLETSSDVKFSVNAADASGLNVASIRDVNSYTMDSKALPAGSYVVITSATGDASAPTAATAEVVIPRSAISESKEYSFLAVGIVDKNGNGIVAVEKKASLTDTVKPTLTSASVSSDSTILVVGFSETVVNVSTGDFVFTINNVDYTPNSIQTITSGTDKGKFYFTFDKKTVTGVSTDTGNLDLNANNINTLSVKLVGAPTIQDVAGNAVNTGTTVYAK